MSPPPTSERNLCCSVPVVSIYNKPLDHPLWQAINVYNEDHVSNVGKDNAKKGKGRMLTAKGPPMSTHLIS